MILKDEKVLLTKRKGSHGEGEYSFPGGHLEYMESFEDCALREIEEECGIKIKNLRFQFLTNTKEYYPRHYVHIGMMADWEEGEPELLEPNKAEGWKWYSLDNLPNPMFKLCALSIEAYKSGKVYIKINE